MQVEDEIDCGSIASNSEEMTGLFGKCGRAITDLCLKLENRAEDHHIASRFIECGNRLVGKFDDFRNNHGRRMNNLRGMAALAASGFLFASAFNQDPSITGVLGANRVDVLCALSLVAGEVTDFVAGQRAKGFYTSFALAAAGQMGSFFFHLGTQSSLSNLGNGLLGGYYLLGLGEKFMVSKFSNSESKIIRRVLGDPRVTAAALSIVACSIFLNQVLPEGNGVLNVAAALWVVEDIFHGVSSRDNWRYGIREKEKAVSLKLDGPK